jgi:hypothetical protein
VSHVSHGGREDLYCLSRRFQSPHEPLLGSGSTLDLTTQQKRDVACHFSIKKPAHRQNGEASFLFLVKATQDQLLTAPLP